jgi:hypothetical protein
MRKVLLATTALVAMGGVSAASADFELSMSSEFKYSTYSDNTGTSTDKDTYASTQDLVVSGSAAFDNGMSGSVTVDMDEGGNADGGFSITGDFGTVAFNDMGYDGGTAADVTADEAHYLTAGWNGGANALGIADLSEVQMPADEQIPEATVSWAAPAVSGFTISAGLVEGGAGDDGSILGIGYTVEAGSTTVALSMDTFSQGTTDATSLGAVVTAGDFVLTLTSNNNEVGTTSDRTGDAMGVTYAVSDTLTVQAYSGTTDDSTDADYKITDTGIGATYTITPGLSVSITNNSVEATTDAGVKTTTDGTALALNVTF